jgi:hemerythrin-like metal-binding protein
MQWTDELALGEARMDETHREFAACLAALAASTDDTMLDALDALIAHSESHFGEENERMAATGFPPAHCHLNEHEGVIGISREVRARVAEGQYELGRVLARELDPWFRNHLQTMDGMLAYWLNLDDAGRAQALENARAAQAAAAAAAAANGGAAPAAGCGEVGHVCGHGGAHDHAHDAETGACMHAPAEPASAEPARAG